MPSSPEPLAHSARDGRPAQTYRDHIAGVCRRAGAFGVGVVAFAPEIREAFLSALLGAARFHDLGKLDPVFQAALRANSRRASVNHVDAGTAHLLEQNRSAPGGFIEAAVAVYSHHRGLPSFPAESAKNTAALTGAFRDMESRVGSADAPLWRHTNRELAGYLEQHEQLCPGGAGPSRPRPRDAGLFRRLVLSCLVDADYSDTAEAGGGPEPTPAPALRPAERLAALDRFVARLGGSKPGETGDAARHELRRRVYEAARRGGEGCDSALVYCDSPVGTGKTTALMAHLLRVAAARGLRRIFVVLPYTNIVDQSVGVYRRALALPGEQPEWVVAANHHRADFSDPALRDLAARWDAPLVVTTAVQFFETLAACLPSRLRKLHELPGSAIFLDEAHAALPAPLWPQAFAWLQELCAAWGCRLVLGSGSLVRFWELDDCVPSARRPMVPSLLPATLSASARESEARRVVVRTIPEPLSVAALADRVIAQPGPRLVILNTVQSAAAFARYLRERRSAGVEHLSTALCPADRDATIRRISGRLRDPADHDWTLAATSCVEAGLDFSFRSGFRESWGVANLLQTAGRVNRHGENGDASVWDFRHDGAGGLSLHPQAELPREILAGLLRQCQGKKRPLGAADCTEAFRLELRNDHGARAARAAAVQAAEARADYPLLSGLFRVIDSPSETVLVDAGLAASLEGPSRADRPSWRQVMERSVQIWASRLDPARLPVKPIAGGELWQWLGAYDAFLGYMAGVLDITDAAAPGGGIL